MLRAFIQSNAGLLLVVASEVFFASMNASVKVLTTGESEVPVFEIILLRMIITYVFSVAYMYWANISNPFLGPPDVRLLLMSRGFFGFIGVFGIYYTLQYLSLSDSIVLTFLSPLCTAIGGSFLLGERFSKREALASIVSLLGVVLIARPPFMFGYILHHHAKESRTAIESGVTTEQRMVAVCVSLIGVLGQTCAYISIRAIGKRAHHLHNMAYFSLWSIIVSSVVMIATRIPMAIPKQMLSLGMLALIGIFGFIAQTLMTIGYQIEAAGRASMGIYSQLIFGVILERLVFGTVPVMLSILGTCLIMGSALYITMTKVREAGDSGNDRQIVLPEGEDIEEGRALFEPYRDNYTEVEE
ncbi:hypothetical protein AX14_009144 [Amanita brunnescens Koide BX004]|nr:hypothetical protein AX14_009144 [Amanita brunnescens Koide BX004]